MRIAKPATNFVTICRLEGKGGRRLGGFSQGTVSSLVVYPPLAEMADDDKSIGWKPGQRKKKSEKVDSTWNPKSKKI